MKQYRVFFCPCFLFIFVGILFLSSSLPIVSFCLPVLLYHYHSCGLLVSPFATIFYIQTNAHTIRGRVTVELIPVRNHSADSPQSRGRVGGLGQRQERAVYCRPVDLRTATDTGTGTGTGNCGRCKCTLLLLLLLGAIEHGPRRANRVRARRVRHTADTGCVPRSPLICVLGARHVLARRRWPRPPRRVRVRVVCVRCVLRTH